MKKPKHINWIFLVILLVLAGFVFAGKLDTTIPTIKLKFVSSDPLNEQQIDFLYFYQGSDIIRGNKFGGYGYSETKPITTGQIVEIPSKRIISFWPFSRFTYLLVHADKKDRQAEECTWRASVWGDEYEYLLDKDINSKETIARYPYDVHLNNEFTFRRVKDQITEIKCL